MIRYLVKLLTSASGSSSTAGCSIIGRVAAGGGGGGAGTGGEVALAEKVVVTPVAIPAPAAAGTEPKFFGALCETVALPKAGALDLNTVLETGVGGTNEAERLFTSSSSACFLANAWRSDQVSFLALVAES